MINSRKGWQHRIIYRTYLKRIKNTLYFRSAQSKVVTFTTFHHQSAENHRSYCPKACAMIGDYITHVKELNIKESWSVLRYIGESCSSIREFRGFTHGRYYYLAGVLLSHRDFAVFLVKRNSKFKYARISLGFESVDIGLFVYLRQGFLSFVD